MIIAKELMFCMFDNEMVQIRDHLSGMMLVAGKASEIYLSNYKYLNCEVIGVATVLDDKSKTVYVVLYVGEEEK